MTKASYEWGAIRRGFGLGGTDLPGPHQSPSRMQGLKGGGRTHPITLSAERITRCNEALSLAVGAENQIMMERVRMDSMMDV